MPICTEVYNILFSNTNPRESIYNLMTRSLKIETQQTFNQELEIKKKELPIPMNIYILIIPFILFFEYLLSFIVRTLNLIALDPQIG